MKKISDVNDSIVGICPSRKSKIGMPGIETTAAASLDEKESKKEEQRKALLDMSH